MNSPQSPLDRLKVLINSSTPIVVMETVEEVRALTLVHAACSDLSLAVFEWTIADGLVRSGASVASQPVAQSRALLFGPDAGAGPKTAMYNTADPVQALANLGTMTIEAVFVLKDFHRHMENPVVVRRLRDVGQKFSANRRTLVLTAPAIEMPPELASLVEFLLPSGAERKQIFSIQLTKRKRNPADYDLDRVAEAAQGFSGAEIESAVQTALYAAFARKQELSSEDLLIALSSTVPLSVTRAEEIAGLRAWAKDRAVWASAPEAKHENA